MSTLYIFIDESGNFDFSPNGTRHVLVCGYSTTQPLDLALEFHKYKYELLAEGINQECFHASEDLQRVRDGVFTILHQSHAGVFDVVYIDKRVREMPYADKRSAYAALVGSVLSTILSRTASVETERVVIIIDQTLPKKDQGYLQQVLKSQLKLFGAAFQIFFFATKSDNNSQIADYGSWASYVELERGEMRPKAAIAHLIKSIAQI
jgi:hypothetical protein